MSSRFGRPRTGLMRTQTQGSPVSQSTDDARRTAASVYRPGRVVAIVFASLGVRGGGCGPHAGAALAADSPPRTLLELGCGGGSLACHLKDRCNSRSRTARHRCSRSAARSTRSASTSLETCGRSSFGRTFDLVLVHDAIMYATEAESLRATLRTAHRHCRPGGAVLVVPDCVKETFEAKTSTGGEDGTDGRGLRYLEWTWDPDPTDDTYETAFAFLSQPAVRSASTAIGTGLVFSPRGLVALDGGDGILSAVTDRSVGS